MIQARILRIGQIVPSSNTTMETEVPALLRAREAAEPERFTFHSSRMRMKQVVEDELARMDADSGRCADELSDAAMDVIAYACLVAIMAMGPRYHRVASVRLYERTELNGSPAPVVTSAGALIDGLRAMNVSSIALITPYMRSLTDLVCAYIEHEGIVVRDRISLEISDNVAVGRRDPKALVETAAALDLAGVDAIVLSACVQMPSLQAIEVVEQAAGLPVVSAATATVRSILAALGLSTHVPGGGTLLNGSY